jgi:hypothetical protein
VACTCLQVAADVVQRLAHQGELLAHPLHGGAHEVRPAVVAAQPEVGTGQPGPPPGGALAEQVGQAQQARAAGRHLRRLLQQLRVEGVGVLTARRRARPRGERERGPAHDGAAVVDGAAEHPPVLGERVAEQPAGGVDGGPGRDGAQRGAGADRHRADPRQQGAGAEGGEHAVGGAEDDRRRGGQSGGAGHLGVERQHLHRRQHLGELVGPDLRHLERLVVPAPALEVEQAGGRGARQVDHVARCRRALPPAAP